jgi:hypothetical protein
MGEGPSLQDRSNADIARIKLPDCSPRRISHGTPEENGPSILYRTCTSAMPYELIFPLLVATCNAGQVPEATSSLNLSNPLKGEMLGLT